MGNNDVKERYRKLNEPYEVAFGPPESGLRIKVRRPDFRRLAYEGAIPTPMLAKIDKMLATWVGQDLTKLSEAAQADGQEALRVLDVLVCEFAVEPRIYMTRELAEAAGEPDGLVVAEIEADDKERLVMEAYTSDPRKAERTAEQESAGRFPGDRPGEIPAPDVQELRPAS